MFLLQDGNLVKAIHNILIWQTF